MARPLYQIFRISPTYCGITDGLIGSQAHRLPMAYCNLAFARKLAGKFAEQDERDGGDDGFKVVLVGRSPYDRDPAGDAGAGLRLVAADDMECPF